MDNLIQLLLEAPITRKYAQDMIKRNYVVSVFYNKKWIKIEPVKIINQDGIDYLIGFQEGKPDELYGYEFSKLTNWNVLGVKKAKRAEEEIKKLEKDKNRKLDFKIPSGNETSTTRPGVRGSVGDNPIEDAIANKRVCRMYYQGDEEEEPGWRTGVKPVCYGSRKNVNYVRAWVSGGKTVSGQKNPAKKALPGWRFFREDRIKNWQVQGTETFTVPPKTNFNPEGDKMMDKIIAIADFNQDNVNEEAMIDAIMEVVRVL